MSGFFEATGELIVDVITALFKAAIALVAIPVGLVTYGIIWVDAHALNLWVVADRVLGSLAFLPAPLSWALICGGVGFLVHLGCTWRRA